MSDYQESLRQRVMSATVEDPPSKWDQHAFFAIGGLLAIGFGRDDRYLLVESHQGRGVFDCETMEKIARDDREQFGDPSDAYRLRCTGIGPLENESVWVAGLFGGGLARITSDGWSIRCVQVPWPNEELIVEPPNCSISDFGTSISRLRTPISEVRAFGFSPNERTLVVATSSDLSIYRRASV